MLVPEQHRDRVRPVGGRSARAVTGYVGGNLLISIIAGLSHLGRPRRSSACPTPACSPSGSAFADLIPLVGATLGAIPTIGFVVPPLDAAPASSPSIFFIAYQQFENHVLQVTVMSRTVNVNPLTVLVSVLVGVELFGLLGALLAIPAAGVIQVVVRDVYDWRRAS